MTREPIYDEESLVAVEQQETEALIAALAQYCKNLERQVVELHHDVNRLTWAGQAFSGCAQRSIRDV